MKVEIVKTYRERGRSYWWVRIRAGNGRIVLVTETYRTRRAALRAVVLLKGAGDAPVSYVEAERPKSRA